MFLKKLFYITQLFLKYAFSKSIFINGTFFNNYNNNLKYINCFVENGKQITPISPVLKRNTSQNLYIIPNNSINEIIIGRCYYSVPIENSSNCLLELLFYRDIYGNEFYGMSNSKHFNVFMTIVDFGTPSYFIF
jgi:hypothetical protein